MKSKRVQESPSMFPSAYKPTRFEYLACAALQGLIMGRAERDLKNVAKRAINLAKEMEKELDS